MAVTLSAIVGIWCWHDYWRYPSATHTTLKAELLPIEATASGTLVIYVQNHSLVTQGQLLCAIDPDPKRTQEKAAQAELTGVSNKINLQRRQVTLAQKQVEERVRQLSQISKQIYNLQQSGEIEAIDQKKIELETIKKSLLTAQEGVIKAYQQLGNPVENEQQLAQLKQKLAAAEARTKITYLYSPVDGLIQLDIANGTLVSPQKLLGNIVKDNAWWVEAEFESFSLLNIKRQQVARISLRDTPAVEIIGVVSQISRAGNQKIVTIRPLVNHQLMGNSRINRIQIDTAAMALPAPSLHP